MTDVGSFVRNHFALTIRAVPQAPLRLEALFDPARLDRPLVAALLDVLQSVLCGIADGPERRVGSIIGAVASRGPLPVVRG
jgi:hypothetical protein